MTGGLTERRSAVAGVIVSLIGIFIAVVGQLAFIFYQAGAVDANLHSLKDGMAQMLQNSYTRNDAERDMKRVDARSGEHERRLDRLEAKAFGGAR